MRSQGKTVLSLLKYAKSRVTMVATSAEGASIERRTAEIIFKRGFITMAKLSKKWLSLLVAALLTLGTMALFTACGPTDPDTPDGPDDPDTPPAEEVIDWSSYTVDEFKAENFDGKAISYQFTGTETQRGGAVLLNLYEDGSACAEHQRLEGSDQYNTYYGFWSEAEDEDGNAITLTIKYMVGMGQDDAGNSVEETAEKNKTYPAMYELSDGTYSFSMDIDLAVGQYTRQAVMDCDNTVKYDTFADFEEAFTSAEVTA